MAMHALRTSTTWKCLVLAWFLSTLGVAVASPLIHPQSTQVVCAAEGSVRIILVDGDGQSVQAGQHALDCSLCLQATLPLPVARVVPPTPQPLAHALKPIVAAGIASRIGAPLPARGPPSPLV